MYQEDYFDQITLGKERKRLKKQEKGELKRILLEVE